MRKTKSKASELPEAPNPKPGDANYYDKILKEGFRASAADLAVTIAKLPPGRFKPVPIEFQRTRERRADFVGKWEAPNFANTILHIEVHGRNEKKLAARQFDTAGLINWHYPFPKWDLIQIVLFIGKKRPTIPTEIVKRDFVYRFRLVWIKDFRYEEFVQTGKLEMLLLASLADYGTKKPEDVFIEIVNEARKIAKNDLDFDQFVEQLHVLSNVHNLHQIFSKVMLNISGLIKEEKDPFFKRGKSIGLQQGVEKGKLEGKLEGISEKMLEVMVNLILKSDHDDEFIGTIVGIEAEVVAEVREVIEKNPKDYQERLKKIALKIKPEKKSTSSNGQ